MEKAKVLDLIQVIATYFKNYHFEDLRFEVEAWYMILQDYEFEPVYERLMAYVKSGERFPPNVGQLISAEPNKRDRAIPTETETRLMIETWDQQKANKADRETAQKALAEMKEMLNGIKRGDG